MALLAGYPAGFSSPHRVLVGLCGDSSLHGSLAHCLEVAGASAEVQINAVPLDTAAIPPKNGKLRSRRSPGQPKDFSNTNHLGVFQPEGVLRSDYLVKWLQKVPAVMIYAANISAMGLG